MHKVKLGVDVLEIRFFNKSEKQLLIDSIDRLWKHDHIYVRNSAVLEHLCLNTPWKNELAGEDEYAFLGMWLDGEVVGLQGLMPQEANVMGETVKALTGTIWIVKKQKGHALNGMAMEEFANAIRPPRYKLSIGFSPRAERVHRLTGRYVVPDMPRWLLVNRLAEAAEALSLNRKMCPYLPKAQRMAIRGNLHIEHDVLEQEPWDAYYREVMAPRTIGTCRDYKFLHWRYEESPVLKYHFITVRAADGAYLGLAVVRIERILEGAYAIGRILEFISFDIEASAALAQEVLDYDKAVLFWDFYCLSDVTAFGLEAAGFRKFPDWHGGFTLPTRFQPLDNKITKLNAAIWLEEGLKDKVEPMSTGQWYVTKGDGDQDRAN